MLKRLLTYCLSLCLALFFLFQGAGFNYVHYCCEDCAAEGIEHVMAESCQAIHEHAHHHHTSDCAHEKGCSFQRLSVSKTIVEQPQQLSSVDSFTLLYDLCPVTETSVLTPVASVSLAPYCVAWQSTGGRTISIAHCSFLL